MHAYSYCRRALCLRLARLVIGGLLCSSRQCAPAGKHVVDLSRRFQCVYHPVVARWEIPGLGEADGTVQVWVAVTEMLSLHLYGHIGRYVRWPGRPMGS